MQRLGLASHTVTIERRAEGKWSPLVSGGSVLPEEAIRFSAHFGAGLFTHQNKATFTVIDSSGKVVMGPTEANALIGSGNAWIDANAPIYAGAYTVVVTGEGQRIFGLFDKGGHDQTRTFRVSDSAPPPAHTDAPNGSIIEKLTPDIGDLFGSPWSWVLILVGLLALGIMI
jgi:hypothetical protein